MILRALLFFFLFLPEWADAAGVKFSGAIKISGKVTANTSVNTPIDFTAPGSVQTLATNGYYQGATDSQFQGPVVCSDKATLVFAHMTNDTTSSATSKSIIVTRRDRTGDITTANIATIASSVGNVHHSVPVIRILPSGRLLAMYRGTTLSDGTSFEYRISTNPCDISAWGSEQSVTADSGDTWQFGFGEFTTAGVMRMIAQGSSSEMSYVELNANESTWQNGEGELVRGSGSAVGGPQPHHIAQNGDRTGIVWASGNAAGCNRDVNYMYTLDGITFRNAGNTVTFTRTSGLSGSVLTDCSGASLRSYASYRARAGRNDWGPKLVLLADNTPVILSNDSSNMMVNKWNGSAWTTVNIASVSTGGHHLALLPSGKLVALNISDSTWNIVAYVSSDSGATWSGGTTIYTKGSENQNKHIGAVAHDPDNVAERLAIQFNTFYTAGSTPTKRTEVRYLDYEP